MIWGSLERRSASSLLGVVANNVVDAGHWRTTNCGVVPMMVVAMDQQGLWLEDQGLGFSRHGLVP
jgi:hypothetical protein